MNDPTVCLICGKLGTGVWTITVGPRIGIADLCVEHAGPLEQIMELAEARPKSDRRRPSKYQSARRKPKFKPLDWTPPD